MRGMELAQRCERTFELSIAGGISGDGSNRADCGRLFDGAEPLDRGRVRSRHGLQVVGSDSFDRVERPRFDARPGHHDSHCCDRRNRHDRKNKKWPHRARFPGEAGRDKSRRCFARLRYRSAHVTVAPEKSFDRVRAPWLPAPWRRARKVGIKCCSINSFVRQADSAPSARTSTISAATLISRPTIHAARRSHPA